MLSSRTAWFPSGSQMNAAGSAHPCTNAKVLTGMSAHIMVIKNSPGVSSPFQMEVQLAWPWTQRGLATLVHVRSIVSWTHGVAGANAAQNVVQVSNSVCAKLRGQRNTTAILVAQLQKQELAMPRRARRIAILGNGRSGHHAPKTVMEVQGSVRSLWNMSQRAMGSAPAHGLPRDCSTKRATCRGAHSI